MGPRARDDGGFDALREHMNVLLVNHTGLVSGAEVATLDLLRALPGGVRAVLACPEGRLADEARSAGIQVAPVPAIAASLRLHPVETARGLVDLVRLGRSIRGLAERAAADVVHAVSIRAALAAALPPGQRRPVVVSIHDCLPPGRVSALTKRVVDQGSAVVVANSRYTAAAWATRPRSRLPRVVHPPVDLYRYRPQADRTTIRARLDLPREDPVLGVVAQITPWKGQETAIRALAHLRETYPRARLELAGQAVFVHPGTRYDNRAYVASLHQAIEELGLEACVRFLGQRQDIPDVLSAIDVLLVPSWEEPFGLVMLEAMAVGTPVVATSRGGPAEVIRDGENGRLVPPDRPELWAEAVKEVLSIAPLRERMVNAGLLTARTFGSASYAEALTGIYHHALSQRRPTGGRRRSPRRLAP
jgi:glycosyltransferase involved in cell wall biosynthesis